jgi:hypothetical protein
MKYLIPLFLLFLWSCKQTNKTGGVPVAKVFDTELMRSEVAAFIPRGASPEDSILMSQSYIRNWVTKRLLLRKAQENLTDDEKNIQQQVEEYRISLLIHQYKQKLIEQKLQSNIKESSIEQYYAENKDNFILNTPVAKALFLILPKSASNIEEVRKWFRSDKPEDRAKLEEYSLTNARKFDNFDDKWIEIKFLLNMIPENPTILENEITSTSYTEKEDGENFYFLRIHELYREQTVAPPEYVREEIILILKNKEKLNFESELDKNINEEAKAKNYVKIY